VSLLFPPLVLSPRAMHVHPLHPEGRPRIVWSSGVPVYSKGCFCLQRVVRLPCFTQSTTSTTSTTLSDNLDFGGCTPTALSQHAMHVHPLRPVGRTRIVWTSGVPVYSKGSVVARWVVCLPCFTQSTTRSRQPRHLRLWAVFCTGSLRTGAEPRDHPPRVGGTTLR